MVNRVIIKPTKYEHVSMLTLAFGSKHCCAKVQPQRAADMAVDILTHKQKLSIHLIINHIKRTVGCVSKRSLGGGV